MTRILVLATYPIKNPQHGGQKRTDAIVCAYKQNFSAVKFSAVFFPGFYKEYSTSDIPVSRDTQEEIRKSPLTGDVLCGYAIYRDVYVKKRVIKLLQDFKPSVIHLEQPFTYLGLKPLLEELNINPKIIFGSQNIEAPMKQEMLEKMGMEKEAVRLIVEEISNVEQELSKNCDLLAACTNSDLDAHIAMGATKTVLARNGVAMPRLARKQAGEWKEFFKKQGVDRLLLFVGSAHPPNWNGFMKMIGKGLGFLPLNTRLILAGSICDIFTNEIKDETLDIGDATFWLRAFSAGRLSEEKLVGLLDQAEVILLPITEGGGSNLKTAEAVIMDKKIVATSHALRSFEWLKEFPNVWVADSQESFIAAIRDALAADFIPRTDEQQDKAKMVLWENCLKQLIREVRVL